ncbi:metal-dependent hydrolase [Halorarum salinum]|uniref:Metal-dependent hydrolase n=1 Tax=Halorarum salinum TaxID=2743089 RepID=A0A7D5LA10_9EURY|nr:metal-dependent hydrolase [Halobaculum salinum]QLG61632.1 metal-dependent hydrolase [Halobaculum salinum]
MYRTGHLGVAMALFAPVAHWLVTAGYPGLAVLTGAAALALAVVPDLDLSVPGLSHRGVTHSLAFALAAGACCGALAARGLPALGVAVPPAVSAFAFGFLLGFGSILGHLAADVITPMGVPFLWPASRRWSLGVTPSRDPVWNGGLFALGTASLGLSMGLALGAV